MKRIEKQAYNRFLILREGLKTLGVNLNYSDIEFVSYSRVRYIANNVNVIISHQQLIQLLFNDYTDNPIKYIQNKNSQIKRLPF